MPVPARLLRTVGRTILALVAGVVTGSLLVAAYICSSLGDGPALVFEGLLTIAALYGAAIAAFCVPIWLALARFGWDRAPAAAALGFLATTAFLVLTWSAGSHDRLELMAYTFVPYALCGAAAAIATWGVDRLLRRSAAPS